MRIGEVILTCAVIASLIVMLIHDFKLFELRRDVDRILESKWFPEPREREDEKTMG